MHRTTFIACALIIISGFAVYANSLNGQFVWDDRYLIKDNIYIKHRSHIATIFSEDIGSGSGKTFNFYRPLQMFTYMVDYSLWKLNVKGYHLSNIAFHTLAALTLYWLIITLYQDRLLSLLASLLFIVHPIHTEAVAYISGRADSLVSLFVFLCLIFYIKHLKLKNITFYILMMISYILALLSRENSLILPALLLLCHYSIKEKLKPKRFISIVSITCLYIILRLAIFSSLLPHLSSSTTLFQRIPGFFVSIFNYTRLLFLPFHLHMEYGDRLFSLRNPKTIVGMLMFSSLVLYAFRKRKSNRLVFFSISWFLLALLPVSNLYPINAYMAEHWLYLPSIGFFLVFAKIFSHLYLIKEYRIFTVVFVITLLALYSCLTIKQNNYWRESAVFYERTLEYVQDNPAIYNNLGRIYKDIGKQDEAIALYKKAIAISPSYAGPYNNLANIYKDIGKQDEAIALYKKAIELNTNFTEAYYNLAKIYKDIGKQDEAIALYKKAIAISPSYAGPYNNLANIYKDIGKQDEAIALYKKAIAIDPDYVVAYNNLSVVYFREKQYKLAIEYCDKARELGFNNPGLLGALKPYRE